MTEEEMTLYNELIKRGKYIEAASIVLAINYREEEREQYESMKEREAFWAAWQMQSISERGVDGNG